MIKPMVEAAARERPAAQVAGEAGAEGTAGALAAATGEATRPELFDEERVRAAVTLALDAALPSLIDKITERVLIALGQ
jgi:hypothetical protein